MSACTGVVDYILDGQEIFHEEEYVPDKNELFEGWYEVKSTEYISYKWSYESKYLSDINAFCNGIPVIKGTFLDSEKYGFPLCTPVLSVVDYNNRIHINLSRDQLTTFPAEEEFVREGYRYVLARLLEEKIIKGTFSCHNALSKGFFYGKPHKIEGKSFVNASHFLFSNDGYTLMSPAFLKHSNIKEMILVCIKSNSIEDFEPYELALPLWLCEMGTSRRRAFFLRAFTSIFEQMDIKEEVVQFIVDKQFYDTELSDYFCKQKLSNRMSLFREQHGYYDFTVDGADINRDINLGFNNVKQDGLLAVIRYRLKYNESCNIMQELLEDCLKNVPWIPYNHELRKKICSDAYKKLEMYITT